MKTENTLSKGIGIGIAIGAAIGVVTGNIALWLSLGIVFVYYLFIILSETFDEKPQLMSWLFPWIPVIGSQIAALILLRRTN